MLNHHILSSTHCVSCISLFQLFIYMFTVSKILKTYLLCFYICIIQTNVPQFIKHFLPIQCHILGVFGPPLKFKSVLWVCTT